MQNAKNIDTPDKKVINTDKDIFSDAESGILSNENSVPNAEYIKESLVEPKLHPTNLTPPHRRTRPRSQFDLQQICHPLTDLNGGNLDEGRPSQGNLQLESTAVSW